MRHQKRLRIAILAAVILATLAVTAASAPAATVSGTVRNSKGYRVLLVQANGTVRTARIAASSGAFSILGVSLTNASLQLVKADGSFYGPIVLKATASQAFLFIKGAANLRIGVATRKDGYAVLGAPPAGRYQTLAAYSAMAVAGRPIGAGKLGRVTTAEPGGLNGPGADLDLDGVINAFDIDDNGNLILDNVDRSGRGSARPRADLSGAAGTSARRIARYDEFRIVSSFRLTEATSINVDIPGINDVDGLIARYLPSTVTLTAQVIGGTAKLDGLGNSYLLDHIVDGTAYPLVNFAPSTRSGGLLDLVAGAGGTAQITPGAMPSEIGAGDTFVETGADGVGYPGTLGFVFNTAPALESYQFNTDPDPTDVTYDAYGVAVQGMTPQSPFLVASDATKVRLTFWRPQRQATAGETGNADGWIDIGGLDYRVAIPAPPTTGDSAQSLSARDASGSHSAASEDRAPRAIAPSTDGGVLDAAPDAPSSSANTVTFTVDLSTCFSNWDTLGSGARFALDVQALSAYGDNAARTLYFELR